MNLIIILLGFFAGSLPFGLLISTLFFGVDLRKHGSGNIGAANALRTIGKKGAAIVLVLDALKGYLPVALCLTLAKQSQMTHHDTIILALFTASAALLGHCFTPWLGFRGGKGVATSLGVVLGLSWQAGVAGLAVYAGITQITRISALGSLGAVCVGAVILNLMLGPLGGIYGAFSVALLLYTHRENLARLRAGRELPLRSSSEGLGSEVPSGE